MYDYIFEKLPTYSNDYECFYSNGPGQMKKDFFKPFYLAVMTNDPTTVKSLWVLGI